MTSISFDNPLYLLIALPLLLLVIIPYVVAIGKTNTDKNTRTSLWLHVAVAMLVALALGGATLTTVITETEVYVLADVSASAEKNLDLIDGHISELSERLPMNAEMGVITFGRDYKLHTPLGGELSSVKNSGTDDSATDITSALRYAGGLFSEGVIKRLVVITDGKQTDAGASGELITAIEQLYAVGVKIDLVYVDNNIKDDAREVQISDVDYTESTYINHAVSADVLVQSSYETEAIVSLSRGGAVVKNLAVKLTKGYNIVNFDLQTDTEGVFDYTVSVAANGDESQMNNSRSFTQSVAAELRVLLISNEQADVSRARELFGAGAVIDAYIKTNVVPVLLEEICSYDEIVLSGVDIRSIENVTAFVDAIDTAVSVYGKSLVTFGDTKIQNKTDDALRELEDMLPVRFGNSSQDAKLVTIVIDTSRSMQLNYKLILARLAAKQLVGLLAPEDYVAIVSFAGTVSVAQTPIQAKNYDKICSVIDNLAPTQGTVIGAALDEAANIMLALPYDTKQVMLISDGVSYSNEVDNPTEIARNLAAANITVSAINTCEPRGVDPLMDITAAGEGEYYYVQSEEELDELMITDIADRLTESIIERESGLPVSVNKALDGVMSGVGALPDIYGYVSAKPKASATTVLMTKYYKASGGSVDVPLYAYWSYGNGRVASFTSTMSGGWVSSWAGGEGRKFFANVFSENIPEECRRLPLDIDASLDGGSLSVTITPAAARPGSAMTLKVVYPDGSEYLGEVGFITAEYRLPISLIGEYEITVSYNVGETLYTKSESFAVTYLPEYDSFAAFDPSALYMAARNRAEVWVDELPALKNADDEVEKFTLSLVIPLTVLALALYTLDVIIRKLKWRDIVSLFGFGKENGERRKR